MTKYSTEYGRIIAVEPIKIRPFASLAYIAYTALLAFSIYLMLAWEKVDPVHDSDGAIALFAIVFVYSFFACCFACVNAFGPIRFSKQSSTYISYLHPGYEYNATYKRAVNDCIASVKAGNLDQAYWEKTFSSLNDEMSRMEAEEKKIKTEAIRTDYLTELKESNDMYLKGIRS